MCAHLKPLMLAPSPALSLSCWCRSDVRWGCWSLCSSHGASHCHDYKQCDIMWPKPIPIPAVMGMGFHGYRCGLPKKTPGLPVTIPRYSKSVVAELADWWSYVLTRHKILFKQWKYAKQRSWKTKWVRAAVWEWNIPLIVLCQLRLRALSWPSQAIGSQGHHKPSLRPVTAHGSGFKSQKPEAAAQADSFLWQW